MPVARKLLNDYLAELLNIASFKDYCPNGLQVEGVNSIERIVTGVTASQAMIEAAIEQNAQAILVHHGYFWKNESVSLVGMKKRRVEKLLTHDINLFAYHLPLDEHEIYGNNVQLAKLMGWQVTGELPGALGLVGGLDKPLTGEELRAVLAEKLNFPVLKVGPEDKSIRTLAWCTGAAQDFLEHAIDAGVDAFISGEISERTVHMAQENDVYYFAAGHHATERGGVKALGEHLHQQFDVDVTFIDLPVPV